MKRSLILLVAIVYSIAAQAQVVTSDKLNVIYAGIPNEISFAVFNYSCGSVVLKADTGILEKVPDKCGSYLYSAPKNTHQVTFKMYAKTKNGLKLVATSVYKIKPLPQPYAYLGAKHGGKISITEFKVQVGITANSLSFVTPDYYFKIDSFSYAVIRNDKLVYWGKNKGELFEQSTKDNLDKVIVGNTISFYNIYYHNTVGETEKLEPFEMYITK